MPIIRLFSSVKFLLLLSALIIAYSFASENETVTPVFKLEWDAVQGWHYPDDHSDYPDVVTVLACRHDNALVLMSPWYSKVKIAKLLIWHGDIPDYRAIGDNNPHPHEYWVIEYDIAEELCK